MYELVFNTILVGHIAIGAIALVLFWLPIIGKKGTPFHKKVGSYFVWSMTTIGITGIILTTMILIDPLAIRDPQGTFDIEKANRVANYSRNNAYYLMMLSFLVLCTTWQSVLALVAKKDNSKMKRPFHLFCIAMLMITGLYVGILGITKGYLLFKIFSVLSLFLSISCLRYIYKKEIKNGEWVLEHVGNIVGSGIAAYTAFFVFGGSSMLKNYLPADWGFVLWILPGVIGTIISRRYENTVRKQYKIAK